ncbi:MAG: hypothetical protein FJ290_25085, partial [Planctomycetes bacterium]|nr:hypothetical protein [Planctomycetota bacterium]
MGSRTSRRRGPQPCLSELLVVSGPSEITGVQLSSAEKRVVGQIAELIRAHRADWEELSVPNLLRKIERDSKLDATAAIHVACLLSELDRDDGRFRYDNLAYQAVVTVVREWRKVQYHAHIGGSVHPGFAWNEMARRGSTLGRIRKKGLLQHGGLGLLWELVHKSKRGVLW